MTLPANFLDFIKLLLTGSPFVAEELKSKGGQVWTYAGSVADRTKVYELADKVRQQVGKVDILINNAGIVSGKTFLETRYAHIFILHVHIGDLNRLNRDRSPPSAAINKFTNLFLYLAMKLPNARWTLTLLRTFGPRRRSFLT